MKLIPSLLLATFVFLTSLNVLHGGPGPVALLKTAGPLGVVAFGFGYAIDLLIFGVLIRKAVSSKDSVRKARRDVEA